MRVTQTQTNFWGGQIAVKSQGFVDEELYGKSLQELTNFVVTPNGGLARRPGTQYIARTKPNAVGVGKEANAVKLIPFTIGFGSENNYVLEFGVYQPEVTITSVTTASDLFTVSGGHGLSSYDVIQLEATTLPTGVSANTDYHVLKINDTTFKICTTAANVTSTTVVGLSGSPASVKVSSRGYLRFYKNKAQLALSSKPYELTTPYNTSAKVNSIRFIQSASYLFLVSPDVPPQQLVYTSDTSWALSEISFYDGPYFNSQELADGTASTVTMSISGTASLPTGINETGWVGECDNGYFWSGVGDSNPAPTDNLQTFSFLQKKNHGLQDGMKVQVSGITSAVSVSASSPQTVSSVTNWQADQSHTGQNPDQTSGDGNLSTLIASITTDGNGTPTITITTMGTGFDPTDTIRFTDPGSTSNTATITLNSAHPSNGDFFATQCTANTFKLTSAVGDAPVDFGHNQKPTVKAYFYRKNSAVTLTQSGAGVWTDTATDAGRLFRINTLGNEQIYWGHVTINTISTHAASCTAQTDIPVSFTSNLRDWKLGQWYAGNYPHFVSLFQQRLVFARVDHSPQTVYFSQTNDFYNFGPSESLGSATGQTTASGASVIGEQVLSFNAMTFTFDSGTVDEIQFLVPQEKLLAGTTGGIYAVYGSEQDLTITPINFTVRREGTQPAEKEVNAVAVDENVLYVEGSGVKVRLINFGKATAGEKSFDVTIRANDILENKGKQIIATSIPNYANWIRDGNGSISCVTYIPQNATIAWHKHQIGGSYDYTNTRGGDPTGFLTSNQTHAVVVDMATIPYQDQDQLWMVVRRTIPTADEGNSHTIIETIEVMENWMKEETIDASRFMDGHVVASSATSVSGLNHLEGITVKLLGDGSQLDDVTVASGAAASGASSNYTTLVGGIGYQSKLVTLPVAIGPGGNARIGNKKRIHKAWIKLYRTPNIKYGIYPASDSDDTLSELVTRTVSDEYGDPPTLLTGIQELIPVNQGYTDAQFQIEMNDSMPTNILAIELDYETNDN
tara:strand:+ start:903 stop:3962 length:3060 start_codon:yes stop_codon:yes gene_type:complete